MTDNTIDGEVDQIVFRCFAQGQYWGSSDITMDGQLNPDYKPEDPIDRTEAVAAITNLIAQEANKAVIKKLEDVMVKVDYTDSDTLITQKALRTHNNIQRELSRLTADKAQP